MSFRGTGVDWFVGRSLIVQDVRVVRMSLA